MAPEFSSAGVGGGGCRSPGSRWRAGSQTRTSAQGVGSAPRSDDLAREVLRALLVLRVCETLVLGT